MGVTGHEYTTCDDEDCPRFICRVYKEGRMDGTEIGRQLGYAEGYPDGYGQGFPDGVAACPRNHSG